MLETNTFTIRPSRGEDIPAVADLLLQLYHAEIPGALRGPMEGQRTLMRHILGRGRAALFRQYVAVDRQGAVLATASLRLGYDRVLGDLPERTLSIMFREIGLFNGLRLFGLLLRRSLTPDLPLAAQSAFLHSVVVDQRMRGQGLGTWLIQSIEQIAFHDGARTMQLRVVVGNHDAKRLYQHLGYRVIGRTPPVLGWITIPTELMHKTLVSST